MARWYSEHPEYAQMSLREKEIRDKIEACMMRHNVNMEGYSYFSASMGVPEDSFDDVADEIMEILGLNDKDVV